MTKKTKKPLKQVIELTQDGGVYLLVNLEDFDSKAAAAHYLKCNEYSSALYDIYNKCRSMLKHGNTEDNQALVSLIEEIKILAADYE